MSARWTSVVLCATVLAGGCSSSDALPTTFVLASREDPRLPVPTAEERVADDEDRALLESVLTYHATRNGTADRHQPIAVTWNELTTELGLNAGLPPPMLARAYALTQVAVVDALLAAHDGRRGELPEASSAAGAASVILLRLFPLESARIKEVMGTQIGSGTDARRAFCLGRSVGHLVLERANRDGSSRVYRGKRPGAANLWSAAVPLLPLAGSWKTWIIEDGTEFAPAQPPVFGSPEDLQELEAVYAASQARTPQQIAAVHKWADLPPPTIWNEYLNERLARVGWSTVQIARASAYLNAAMYDGFVSCWHAKYLYWTQRPYMRLADRIPKFTTVVTTPPFPSYTSGHSTVSGAAAMVLGHLFPDEEQYFTAEAHEAAVSRLWAGIHFGRDNDEGLSVGRKIGGKAVERMRRDTQER